MALKYKFIHFTKCDTKPFVYACRNNRSGDVLGFILYYPAWRQHVIEFTQNSIFNNECLQNIAEFLGELNDGKHKD